MNSALNEDFVKIKRSCCHYKNKIKCKEISELKESVFGVKNTRSKVYLFEGLTMNDGEVTEAINSDISYIGDLFFKIDSFEKETELDNIIKKVVSLMKLHWVKWFKR